MGREQKRRTGLSDGVFKRFEVSTCGMEGAYKTGTDLINYEQTLLSLIGRTKLQFVSSPRPLGSLQLTTGQKF